MAIQASWLTKKWTIDRSGILALENISLTKELDVEEGEAKDGKAPTITKGYTPQSLTTTHKVSLSAGADPLQEYESWVELLGKRAGFHIEGRRIGPAALILDAVSFSASALSNTGEILAGEISLTFSEDVNFQKAPSVVVEKYVGDQATPENAPGYNPGGQVNKSAYNIRPSASAAEQMGG
jgi:hypothetical protein